MFSYSVYRCKASTFCLQILPKNRARCGNLRLARGRLGVALTRAWSLILNVKRNWSSRAAVPTRQMARRPFSELLIRLAFTWAGQTRCEHCSRLLQFRARDTWDADHRNGHDDNTAANLQILCVACHAEKTAAAGHVSRAASPTQPADGVDDGHRERNLRSLIAIATGPAAAAGVVPTTGPAATVEAAGAVSARYPRNRLRCSLRSRQSEAGTAPAPTWNAATPEDQPGSLRGRIRRQQEPLPVARGHGYAVTASGCLRRALRALFAEQPPDGAHDESVANAAQQRQRPILRGPPSPLESTLTL